MSTIRDTSGQDKLVKTKTVRKGRFILTAGALAILTLGFFIIPSMNKILGSQRTISRQQIQVANVNQGVLQRDIAVQGRVVAAISPTLFATSSGTVSLNYKAGDTVKKGDVLAKVDSPELLSEYAQQKATLEEIEMEYKRQEIVIKTDLLDNQQRIELAQVDLELARKNMERADINIKTNVISQVDYEQQKAELKKIELQHKHAIQNATLEKENFEFELEARKLQLDRQQFVVSEVERQVNRLNIVSPISGVIGNVFVNEKDAINQNSPVMTIVDLTAFELEVNIPESYADELGVGLNTTMNIDNKIFKGELAAISPEVINGQVTGRIRFTEATPEGLRQNQRISSTILIESKSDVLKVKRGSFVNSSGGRFVFVVEDDVATKRSVVLGSRSISEIEVLSGLQKGEEIIISNVEQFASLDQLYISQ